MSTEEIIDRLQQATVDLLWISESDYPFQIVTWSEKEIDSMLFADRADEEIEAISLDDFFAPALKVEDWYEAEELATVDRYKLLLQTIQSNLTELKVFRLGAIEIDVYIIGKTPNLDIIGLKTTTVET
jgi:Nuclease A inhibitor-like protein